MRTLETATREGGRRLVVSLVEASAAVSVGVFLTAGDEKLFGGVCCCCYAAVATAVEKMVGLVH